MSDVPKVLAEALVLRAWNRCEYCRLSQIGQEATFHIDHITPRKIGGPTTETNLALACVSCSLRKGAKESWLDPKTRLEIPLFHPRNQRWSDHFRWDGITVLALTECGAATVEALALNRPSILRIRFEETHFGRHPPS